MKIVNVAIHHDLSILISGLINIFLFINNLLKEITSIEIIGIDNNIDVTRP